MDKLSHPLASSGIYNSERLDSFAVTLHSHNDRQYNEIAFVISHIHKFVTLGDVGPALLRNIHVKIHVS